ncbi:LOW QUALITY PROTEIN: conserved hypothetical protein, partial [Brucella suis bv. 3 str. 686]
CRKPIGLPAWMFAIPNATRIMFRRPSPLLSGSARISSLVAARRTRWRGRARNVIIEFETMQHALDCYNSPEYQAAAAIRQTVADGEIVIVEGI